MRIANSQAVGVAPSWWYSPLVDGRIRLVCCAVAFLSGVAAHRVGTELVGSATAIFLIASALSVSLALSKTTTACGLNVLGSLSPPAAPIFRRLGDASVYAAVATLTAALIGSLIGVIGSAVGATQYTWLAVIVLGYLGFKELGAIPTHRVLSLRWQVPAHWVRGRRTAPAVWGIFLGAGIATAMPFPTYFGLLVLAVVLAPPAGLAIMGLYGASRAFPAMVVAMRGEQLLTQLTEQAWQLRLAGHVFAGLAGLAAAGAMTGSLL
jgi:hypothetical protein